LALAGVPEETNPGAYATYFELSEHGEIFIPSRIGQRPGPYGKYPCNDLFYGRIENQQVKLQQYGEPGDIECHYRKND
jgi:hypothetical protein